MEDKSQEFLKVIKESIQGDGEVDENDYVDILTEYTNYVCGEESFEEIYQYLAKRLSKKMEEIGEEEFTRISHSFLEKIKKEDEEFDRLEMENRNKMEERTKELQKRNEEAKMRMDELKIAQEKLQKQKELDMIKRQEENALVMHAQKLLDTMITNENNNITDIFREFKIIITSIHEFDIINYVKIMVIIRTFITICDKLIKNNGTDDKKRMEYIEMLKEFRNEYNKNIDIRKKN